MNRVCQVGRVLTLTVLPLLSAVSQADHTAVGSALTTPAMQVAPEQKSVFIDLARAGNRLVAVGERGLVMLSDDNGEHWRQAQVPVSVTLGAVQFVDAQHGWAVGHAGVVLGTVDGGEHWVLQLDGVRAAQLELDAVTTERTDAADPDAAEARVQSAERLVAEGADKPFLALQFVDAKRGLIVGAYGLVLETLDGGATWRSRVGHIDNPAGMHLYAISRQGSAWFLAGEQGYLARSEDDGRSFQQLESPYAGTFFTLQIRADGAVLVGGLKGNAFISTNAGDSFQPLPVAMPVSFSDATPLANGQVLLANQAGGLFRTLGNVATLVPFTKPLGNPVSSVIQAADGSVVVAGFTGLLRVPQPALAVSE